MGKVIRAFCWHQKFVPGAIYIYKIIKNVFKIRFLFINLQRMGKVIRAFCWHQKFVSRGLYTLAPGLYTCIRSLKMSLKSDFEEIILKLATFGQREKAFLLSSKFCPQWIVCPCPGYIHVEKRVEVVLKFATNGQSDKGFLLTSTFVPKGLLPLPWGYIHV